MGDFIGILILMMVVVGLPLWLNHTTSVFEAVHNMLLLDRTARDETPGFYTVYFAYKRGEGSATALLRTILTIWKLPLLAVSPS